MKKILIVLLIVIIAGFGFVVFSANKKDSSEEEDSKPTIALPTVTDNVKVDLSTKENNKVVVLKISGIPSGIELVEYEITYTTGDALPRGVLGKITVSGEKEILRDDIVLGTCSSGKCVYDQGVTEVNLSLKFNSSSGSSVFHKTYPL